MSRSVNKVILVGNVGRDPDIRTTPGGTRVATVSLATSRRFPTRDGTLEERTEWHRLNLWDKLAQLAEDYIRKGDRLYIEGRMEYGTFERNGVTIPTADVRVLELVMLGSGNAAGESPPPARTPPASKAVKSATKPEGPFNDEEDDDLPF